jgi:hypothetical protein
MRNLTTAIASAAAVGLLFVVGGGPSLANTSVRASTAFVTPDAHRTKTYFITMEGSGSFAVPTINGLSGTITYDCITPPPHSETVKIWTGWGNYGNPPSSGRAIVAYLQMRFPFYPPQFFGTGAKSSITYSGLNPSKSYNIEVWDVTNTPSEVKLWSIGSPSNGTLSFESPLDGMIPQENFAVWDLELTQNP